MNAPIPELKPYIGAETVILANYLTDRVAAQLGTTQIEQQHFINWLNAYVYDNTKPVVELSGTRPSFEGLKQQFHAILSQRDAWKDVIQAAGGQTILDFITAVGALGQGGIVTALQENNTDGAALTSSIYTLMRMLGVHIRRKIPAYVDVEFQNLTQDNVYIPRLSQFVSNGIGLFNRDPIIVNNGVASVTVRLFVGGITMETYTSNGSPYQIFELGNNDYTISDTDLTCYLEDGRQWRRVEDGLWKYSATDRVFFENTSPDGNVEIRFGNNVYGAIPPANSTLQFVYAKTPGNVNNTSDSGRAVELVALNEWVPDRIKRLTEAESAAYTTNMLNNFRGQTRSGINGGSLERDKEHYRAVGPFLNSGRKGMIRRSDHYAVGLEYPGVVDILFRGQAQLDRYDRNLINVCYVSPLMDGGRAMTAGEWLDFVKYLDDRQIWRLDWVHVPVEPVFIDVEADIYAYRNSNLQSIESYAEYNLLQNFGVRRGSLGFAITLDDIYDSLNLNFENLRVDYVDIKKPLTNIPIGITQFAKLNRPTINVNYTSRRYSSYIPPRPDHVEPA